MFGRSKRRNEEAPDLSVVSQDVGEFSDLESRTEAIEAEKAAKKMARAEKKFLKELQRKRKARERWVAPIILLVTVIISLLLWRWSSLH